MSRIAIIGGGLAGTACTYLFPQFGIDCVLFEAGPEIAHGASGNPLGIYNPRLSAEWSEEAEFYTAGFELAIRLLKNLPDIDFIPHGSLHLITTADKKRRFCKMVENWPWPEEQMRYVRASDASEIAGIEVPYDAIYLPLSGAVSPYKLCYRMAENCDLRLSTPVNELQQEATGWLINGEFFDCVVLACGAGVKSFWQMSWLPVHTVRGQIVQVKEIPLTQALQCNLCFGGYVTPSVGQSHMVGSSFQKWLSHTEVIEEDNQDILTRLHSFIPSTAYLNEIVDARAALRTSSQDRLPIIGSLPEIFPGCFLSTAHGSHGIISSLIGAQMIAGQIKGLSPFPFSRTLSPERFINRAKRKKQSLPSFLQ
jgi:tRNA 5-methylaminomethyl-2-thiouridine biosynthesis bifunctional protein